MTIKIIIKNNNKKIMQFIKCPFSSPPFLFFFPFLPFPVSALPSPKK